MPAQPSVLLKDLAFYPACVAVYCIVVGAFVKGVMLVVAIVRVLA